MLHRPSLSNPRNHFTSLAMCSIMNTKLLSSDFSLAVSAFPLSTSFKDVSWWFFFLDRTSHAKWHCLAARSAFFVLLVRLFGVLAFTPRFCRLLFFCPYLFSGLSHLCLLFSFHFALGTVAGLGVVHLNRAGSGIWFVEVICNPLSVCVQERLADCSQLQVCFELL